MQMKIVAASVLSGYGADIVNLYTTLPCPLIPAAEPSQPPLKVSFEATKGTGADYVKTYFDIDPRVIDIR